MSAPKSKRHPPSGRKWLFRLGALLLPLFAIGLLELALRLADYGHPTSFFLRRTVQGRDYFVENPHFGFRFFPPGVARSPVPILMPAKKDPGTIRVFLLGESAALGDPKPAFGMGRYLEILLANRFPDRKFEVICAAMTAINSHVILPIARECARRDGDLWIVYMGNNEMIGPYGGAALRDKMPALQFLRASIFLKSTRTGQLLESVAQKFSKKKSPTAWEGLQLFSENQIASDDPIRARVDSNFASNLSDIIQAGQGSGAKVLVSSVAVNLADCAPHASTHSRAALSLDQWKKHYDSGVSAHKESRYSDAIQSFSASLDLDPGYAEVHFLNAVCQEKVTNAPAAFRAYQSASDTDALSFRSTSARNGILKTVALSRKADFIPLAELISDRSSFGVPGHNSFLDHVHFNFDGNYAAARSFASVVEKLMALNAPKGDWLSQSDCEAQLGLTDWNRFLAYENMSDRITQGVYTNQITNAKSRQWLRDRMNECRRRVKENPRAEEIYKAAILKRPSDFYLKQNYAEYLELASRLPAAREQWQALTSLLPHHPVAYFQSGRLAAKIGKTEEAIQDFEQSLRIRPDFLEARIELGLALRKTGKVDQAIGEFRTAIDQDPRNASAHFHLADALAFAKQDDEAILEMQEAIRLRPNYWEARYLLGVAYAMRGNVDAAAPEFRLVTQLKPDFALGHFNLGVALAHQKQIPAAVQCFETTLKIDPSHAGARQHLDFLRKVLAEPNAPVGPNTN